MAEAAVPPNALPLPRFQNKAALETWFALNFNDTNNRTNSPSYFDQLPNPGPYWRGLNTAGTPVERDAILSRYNEECLGQAPPLREQCWILNETFAEKAIQNILDGLAETTANVYREMDMFYPRYLPVDAICTDPRPVELYRKSCLVFREFMGETDDGLTGILTGEVQTRLAVHPETAARLRDMLQRMRQQTERRYGAQNARQDSTELLNGVKAFLRDCGETEPPVPLTATNRMDIAGFVIVQGDRPTHARAAANGIHLISTAIMQLRSKNDVEIEGLLETFGNRLRATVARPGSTAEERRVALTYLEWKAIWDAEAVLVTENNEGQGVFSQQSAGIDLLFSAFYWAVKCGVTDYASLKRLNRFLYSLGLRSVGSRKMREYLASTLNPCGGAILRMISDSKDVHLPPFVLTCARVSDLVAALGAFTTEDTRVNDVGRYACSDRYILNLRREETMGLAFLTLSWAMWDFSRRGHPAEDAICVAEHLLHQYLLRKKSPFQNTHQLGGNALNVEIIDLARDDDDLDEDLFPRPPPGVPPVGEDRPEPAPGAPRAERAQPRIEVMDQRRRVLPGRSQTARTRALMEEARVASVAIRDRLQGPPPAAPGEVDPNRPGARARGVAGRALP